MTSEQLLSRIIESATSQHWDAHLEAMPLPLLLEVAAALCTEGHGNKISYSKKVFLPLTHLCRDVCHYCTFARPPRRGERSYLTIEAMVEIAKQGRAQGCKEALFTLGDKPELRYRAAREELQGLGHDTTLSYLAEAAEAVTNEVGLLAHFNPGVMSLQDFRQLRPFAASMGLMLETTAARLSGKGGPHFGSPDKHPSVRIQSLADAGEARVPTTTGILIGIGETRRERIEAILTIRDLHRAHGHIQELIVQNFVAKPGTKMATAPDANEEELLWTIAVARILLGARFNIQAPPNLAPGRLEKLLAAGINDWGGISPVTPDHVNPERPWPAIEQLHKRTAYADKELVERLTLYPEYARQSEEWTDPKVARHVLALMDAQGYARGDNWHAGRRDCGIPDAPAVHRRGRGIDGPLSRAVAGAELAERDLVALFEARGPEAETVCEAADELRRKLKGNAVTFVVNRNINYTNICSYRCAFCAFSKGKTAEHLRGRAYEVSLEEVARRVSEAWQRGATEVCLQGGIHPRFTGETYLEILRAAKQAQPDIHVHAFSPLEVHHGATSLGTPVRDYLMRLRDLGLGSLPGTAAEILDDEVRRVICPDKLSSDQWLDVVEDAHSVGLPTTATIMFGHVDSLVHGARHLLRVRRLQERTGGITEFVPLPFVALEAPIFLKGKSRAGPTWREALLMHAVARLALNPLITNIQTSWVKMGTRGAAAALQCGANDIGGTLMNESITRAAGADHGEEFAPQEIERLVGAIGRTALQRTTLYGEVSEEVMQTARCAAPLAPLSGRHPAAAAY